MGRGFSIRYPAASTYPAERQYESLFGGRNDDDAQERYVTVDDRDPAWRDRYIVGWSYSTYNGGAITLLEEAGYVQVLRPVTDPDGRYYAADYGWIVGDHERAARYPTLPCLWPPSEIYMEWDTPTCAALAAELRALVADQADPTLHLDSDWSESEADAHPDETPEARFLRIGREVLDGYAPLLAVMCDEAAARGGTVTSG